MRGIIFILCLLIASCADSRSVVRIKRNLNKYESPFKSTKDIFTREENLNFHIKEIRGGFTNAVKASPISLSSAKFLMQLVLTTFSIICWSLPLHNHHLQNSERALSIANSFAGGIFLMLSFGHLIPDAMATLSSISTQDSNVKTLSYVTIGFLAILFVEKVAFSIPIETIANEAKPQKLNIIHNNKQTTKSNGFHINSAIILCLALAVHSFFESAALGLAPNFSTACLLSACIALHQPAESLALVVAFLKTNMTKRHMAMWLFACSIMSVIGNLAGLVINAQASPHMEAMIVAITAGTFVYVSCTEIVGEEFNSPHFRHRLQNFLAYVIGMITMTTITLLVKYWGHT